MMMMMTMMMTWAVRTFEVESDSKSLGARAQSFVVELHRWAFLHDKDGRGGRWKVGWEIAARGEEVRQCNFEWCVKIWMTSWAALLSKESGSKCECLEGTGCHMVDLDTCCMYVSDTCGGSLNWNWWRERGRGWGKDRVGRRQSSKKADALDDSRTWFLIIYDTTCSRSQFMGSASPKDPLQTISRFEAGSLWNVRNGVRLCAIPFYVHAYVYMLMYRDTEAFN